MVASSLHTEAERLRTIPGATPHSNKHPHLTPEIAHMRVNAEAANTKGQAGRKLKGVRQRRWGKWVAEIREPNKRSRIWLGSHETADMAARAYDAATLCLRGPQASTFNFPHSLPSLPSPAPSSTKDIQHFASLAAASARPPLPPASCSPSTPSAPHTLVFKDPPFHESNYASPTHPATECSPTTTDSLMGPATTILLVDASTPDVLLHRDVEPTGDLPNVKVSNNLDPPMDLTSSACSSSSSQLGSVSSRYDSAVVDDYLSDLDMELASAVCVKTMESQKTLLQSYQHSDTDPGACCRRSWFSNELDRCVHQLPSLRHHHVHALEDFIRRLPDIASLPSLSIA